MPRNHRLVHAILFEPWLISINNHNHELIRVMINGVLNPNLEPESSDAEEPKNVGTVKVIPITGVLTKYDVMCGGYGMQTYGSIIQGAIDDPSIDAIVLRIDSPGGMVSGTSDLAKIIHNSSKPIVAYVDDFACSGAYWLASAASEIIANNDVATVGSIGVMCSWTDYQEADKMQGIKDIAVAAPQSVDKLRMSQEMDQGNYTTLTERLSGIADFMIFTITTYRPSITADQLTGNIYFAKDVVGSLVDSVGSIDMAIDRALSLASNQSNINNKIENNMPKPIQTPRMAAVLGVDELCSADGSVSLNDEQTTALEAELEAHATSSAAHTATVANLTAGNATLTAENTRLAADNATLTARVAELEPKAGAAPAVVELSADGVSGTPTTLGQALASATEIANLYK